MAKNRTDTKTLERVLTKEEISRAMPQVELTPEEELVVRMRFGIPLSPDGKISYRGAQNEELQVRLALMEKALLDMMENREEQETDRAILDRFTDI